MDIKQKIEELVKKIQSDPAMLEKFRKEPVKTVEGILGVDLPDDQIEKLVKGVQAKLDLDKIGGALGGLKGLFGK